MEAVDSSYTRFFSSPMSVTSDSYISDVHDGRFIAGSYMAHWFQPVGISEIWGARNLGLDPNNIEYYLISEQERLYRAERERRERSYSFEASEAIPNTRVGDTITATLSYETGELQINVTRERT